MSLPITRRTSGQPRTPTASRASAAERRTMGARRVRSGRRVPAGPAALRLADPDLGAAGARRRPGRAEVPASPRSGKVTPTTTAQRSGRTPVRPGRRQDAVPPPTLRLFVGSLLTALLVIVAVPTAALMVWDPELLLGPAAMN